MKCVKCKADIPENSVFCNICGKKQVVTKNKSRKRANGQGSVYKLSGNRNKPYVAALPASYSHIDGSKKQLILGYYESKTAALNALNERISKGATDRASMTLKQCYDEWFPTYKDTVTPKVVDVRKLSMERLKRLHNKKMTDIRANDIQRICDEYPHFAGNDIKILYSYLCKYAMSLDIIYQDYSKFIKLKDYEKKQKRAFTHDEIAVIKQKADANDEIAIAAMIMIFTGLRKTEFLTLTQDNINLDENYIRAGIKTEAGKNRIIPIHPCILDYVKHIYYNGIKYKPSYFSKLFKFFTDELKFENVSPHTCRHTFATLIQEAGVAPEDIIKIIGHSNYKITTETYIHQTAEKLSNAINKIEGIE